MIKTTLLYILLIKLKEKLKKKEPILGKEIGIYKKSKKSLGDEGEIGVWKRGWKLLRHARSSSFA